jgi:hypothetical protein
MRVQRLETGGPIMMPSERRRLRVMPSAEQFQLETLEGLPCGCIVAIHTVRPSHVMVVSLETKGPYCTIAPHRANKVIRLGGSVDALGYEDEEDPSI